VPHYLSSLHARTNAPLWVKRAKAFIAVAIVVALVLIIIG